LLFTGGAAGSIQLFLRASNSEMGVDRGSGARWPAAGARP
jgi:hypothetical protein